MKRIIGIAACCASIAAAAMDAQPVTFTTLAGRDGGFGSADGQGNAARFYSPGGIAADAAGNLYVTDTYNHSIRKVTAGGDVTTLAGLAGSIGSADGQGTAARFNYPVGIAADAAGNLYVTDSGNNTVRKVTAAGGVTTLAGFAGSSGSDDGQGGRARFNYPGGIAADAAGNLYVSDTDSHTIRKLTAAGEVSTLAGLAWSFGSADGPGSAARFYGPAGIAADAAGNLYVTDNSNHTIRKVTAAGDVTTLAGLAGRAGSEEGTGVFARFNYPAGIAVDLSGDIYVTDTANSRVQVGRPGLADICTPGGTVLCLNNGRFRVSANWQSPQSSGAGTAIGLTSDTGYFWFFNSANVEMVVKVLDGCGINGRYWVFAAGLTNVGVNLTVEDTQTGAVRTYTNPINTPFQPIQDTAAFATCP